MRDRIGRPSLAFRMDEIARHRSQDRPLRPLGSFRVLPPLRFRQGGLDAFVGILLKPPPETGDRRQRGEGLQVGQLGAQIVHHALDEEISERAMPARPRWALEIE